MEVSLFEGFLIAAMSSGTAQALEERNNGGNSSTQNNASAESPSSSRQVVDPKAKTKRKRYRVPTDAESKRLVEEHTKHLSKDDGKTCIICCARDVEVELIHSEWKKGEGKEHLCKNNRFCKDCVANSVAGQETTGSYIIPQCPCCKQRVAKCVNLEDTNVVSNLPPFLPQTFASILSNASYSKLSFCYSGDTTDGVAWEVLAPHHIKADKQRHQHNSLTRLTSWKKVWACTLRSAIPSERVIGWPTPRELLRHINIKLNEAKQRDLNWLPPVYGGKMEVPKDIDPRKRKRSETARTPAVSCDCSVCLGPRASRKKRKKATARLSAPGPNAIAGTSGSSSSSSSD